MIKPALLSEYDELAGSTFALLSEENRHLRTTGRPPDQELLNKKRSLLARLEEQLVRLKQAGGKGAGWPAEELVRLQQRFLQIVRLDRENEKLFLAALSNPAPAAGVAPEAERAEAVVKPARWRLLSKYVGR